MNKTNFHDDVQIPEGLKIFLLTDGIKDLKPLEDWGIYLASKAGKKGALTSSQIRRFFGALKRIQADFDNLKGEILLLSYKLAYAVGRDKKENGQQKTKIDDFYQQLNPMIRNIQEDQTKFNNFVRVVEALVAFHKANGGN